MKSCTLQYLVTLLSVVIMGSQYANAQIISNTTLNTDFAAQVKSIDEFICRFNGTEANPEIKKDTNWRTNNLMALFDYQMDRTGLSDNEFRNLLTGFVNQVIANNVTIQITDAAMWAEAKSCITIDEKKISITLVLQSETYNENLVRWAIVGVRGLTQADIIDTTKYFPISPVEHELHFMSLDDIFQRNHSEIMGYRGKDVHIDELSVLLALAMVGKIRFNEVDKLTIHCLEVPGYVFTINEQIRSGNNSGWLISKLITLKEKDKKQYIQKLLNR